MAGLIRKDINMLDYDDKMVIMDRLYRDYTANPLKYTCLYKAIPVALIDEYKKFIDFTRFYIMYRGPRKGYGNCTLKKDAIKADIYQYSTRDTNIKRKEREDYLKYYSNIK
jgi:hypothetical protein